MNILITGATGFIGRFLVQRLCLDEQNNIFCLVRKNSKNIKYLTPFKVKFIYADITEASFIKEIKGLDLDVIFHCAGYVGNKRERLCKVNVLGTKNICELALKLNIKKMVYLSSVAVVSGNENLPLVEDLPYKATNIYGISKIEAEKIVLDYRKKGLKVVILRPCMVYGESEPHLLGLFLFLLKHRLFPLIDEGKYKLHLLYVKNLIEAMIFSLSKEEFTEGTFFVADKEILTLKEIVDIFVKAIKAKPPLRIPSYLKPVLLNLPFLGRRLKFFLKDRIYSIKKLLSLGFKHPYPANLGLRKSAEFWLKYSKDLSIFKQTIR